MNGVIIIVGILVVLTLLKQLFDHDYVALGLSIVALLIVLFSTHHFR